MLEQYKIKFSLIKLDDVSFHIITEGRINDAHVNLIIDTGASTSVFDSEYLKDHLPVPGGKHEIIHSAGISAEKIETSRSVAETFVIGKLIMHQYPLILINMNRINGLYSKVTGKNIHGLIGSDFLSSMNAVIDFGKSLMILKPRKNGLKSLKY